MKYIQFLCLYLMVPFILAYSQERTDKVYVDQSGVLRWTNSNKDVALFGINYSVPFAHSYRSIKRLGLDHKRAIDIDVSQFARLELDAYRIHVWDREICDREGNLIENEHLELLDYLIHKLEEKNIYINLIYTPQKAASLMIAANVFRETGLYQHFDSYPRNLEFNGFKISYKDQLCEMISADKFYYSNDTQSQPNPEQLKHIAGAGSSGLVRYNGTGVYFLDKIQEGIWRLEIYPNIVKLKDPFGKNGLDGKVVDLTFFPVTMKILLPDLTTAFYCYSLTEPDSQSIAENAEIKVKPGLYILSQKTVKDVDALTYSYRHRSLKEYAWTGEQSTETFILHENKNFIFEGETWKPEFKILSANQPQDVHMYAKKAGWNNFRVYKAERTDDYKYMCKVSDISTNGKIEYCLCYKIDGKEITFPGNIPKNPNSWDFFSDSMWRMKVIPGDNPVTIFDPQKDITHLNYPNIFNLVEYSSNLVWNGDNRAQIQLAIGRPKGHLENFTFQIESGSMSGSLLLSGYKYIELNIDKENTNLPSIVLRIVDDKNIAMEAAIELIKESSVIRLALEDLKPGNFLITPSLPAFFTV
ncbi:hypothetical protein JW935_12430 [candidate division KSB1 bacterium]|nr:hypothetical protein [candidate division KSB1 bacterium]